MAKTKKPLRKIDAPIYNYLQALYLSFFNSSLYVDVVKRWRGLGLLYLLLVMFIATIPFSLRMINDFNLFFNDQLIEPLRNIPPLYIQNGKVSFDKPMPYFIKNKQNQVVSIIDITGKVKTITSEYPHVTILITEDALLYRIPAPQFFFAKDHESVSDRTVAKQPLSKNLNQVFDGSDWVKNSGIMKVKYLSQLIIYPTVALIFFVVYAIFLLILALIGQLVAKLFMKLSLSYAEVVRLLAVSATPQIFLLILMLTTNISFKGESLFLIAVLAIYFSYALLAVKRDSRKVVLK